MSYLIEYYLLHIVLNVILNIIYNKNNKIQNTFTYYIRLV